MKFAISALLVLSAWAALLQEARPLVGWVVSGPADGGRPVNVMLAMRTNDARVKAHLDRVSDPASPDFRKWASSVAATAELRSPAPTGPVLAWLSANGIRSSAVSVTPTGDVVTVHATVAQAERLFSTTIHTVLDQSTGRKWHHAGHLFAPDDVVASVSAVFGLHGLPLPPRRRVHLGRTKLVNNRTEAIIPVGPTEIRAAYNVTGRGSGTVRVRQAVAEFQGQFANTQDLQLFFTNLVPAAQPGDSTVYAYRGNIASGYGIEALLDIEYIMGIGLGVKTEFWGWQNFDFCTDLKNWTTTIINDAGPPVVFSVSYGWQGNLGQIGCTQSEVNSIDADFATIANRGISIIFASGDSGSAWDGTQLWPSWPASSPYVTAVGSTCFTDSSQSVQEATTQFGSGSGFSALFTVGSWQRRPVNAYIQSQTSLPPAGTWTPTGRATADVSALGEGFKVYVDGQVEIVGGTSASAPTFAAIISLINDKAVTGGGSTLGYLNPWLYANPGFFTDITLGTDKIDRGGNALQYGFNAAEAWDPPTGLGVPRFDRIHP